MNDATPNTSYESTIGIEEDKRMELIKKIKNFDPKFDHDNYIKSCTCNINDHYPEDGEYISIRDQAFLIYPPNRQAVSNNDQIDKRTLDTVINSFPILKNYIYTNNDSEELYETTILPQTKLFVDHQGNLQEKLFLSWDLMSLYINIYSQYNNTDNVAVIPPFVSVSASIVRKLRIEIKVLKMKLTNEKLMRRKGKKLIPKSRKRRIRSSKCTKEL